MPLIFDDKERVGAWVAEQVEQRAEWGSFYAMGAEVDGKIVSGVVFNNFNECNAISLAANPINCFWNFSTMHISMLSRLAS